MVEIHLSSVAGTFLFHSRSRPLLSVCPPSRAAMRAPGTTDNETSTGVWICVFFQVPVNDPGIDSRKQQMACLHIKSSEKRLPTSPSRSV